MKAAQEDWIEEQCSEIEHGMERGNSKKAYTVLKILTKTTQAKASVIEDKDGKLLTDGDEVLRRWSEYCSDLYNHETHPDNSILQDNIQTTVSEDSPPILKGEVEAAIRSLKEGKSPGVDNNPGEILKHGGEESLKALTALCQKIWEE